MNKIGSPRLRYEVILELTDFANPQNHKKEFCSQEKDDCFYAGVEEPIECLFDKDFESSSNETVGEIFRNVNEIQHMRRLGINLRKLQKWIQRDGQQKDSYYMDSFLWKEITKLAREAHEVLMKDEDLDALLEAEETRVVQ